jgi:hypothetical protein
MTPRRFRLRRADGLRSFGRRAALALLAAAGPLAPALAQTVPPAVLAPPAERITVPPPPRPEVGMPVPEAPVLAPVPPGAEAVRLVPRAILVEGATAILPDRIEAETRRLIDREVTVAEIFALAQRLESSRSPSAWSGSISTPGSSSAAWSCRRSGSRTAWCASA